MIEVFAQIEIATRIGWRSRGRESCRKARR